MDYKHKMQLLGAIVYRIECEEVVSKNVLEESMQTPLGV